MLGSLYPEMLFFQLIYIRLADAMVNGMNMLNVNIPNIKKANYVGL